jgi:hypothetical protein
VYHHARTKAAFQYSKEDIFMHSHLEIIIPPTDDIEGSIAAVMKQYDESLDPKNEDYSTKHVFWDWYVIGGRWAGNKLMAKFDPVKIEEFQKWCAAEKLTVSGVVAGKQRLQPESQIPKVDAKWNELFGTNTACPMFDHSNDQYGRNGDGTLPDDVLRLGDLPDRVTCSRVIFAGPSFNHEAKEGHGKYTGPLESKFMFCDEVWNGCNHMKVEWDGTVKQALEKYRESFRKDFLPTADWLVVTVDYHS